MYEKIKWKNDQEIIEHISEFLEWNNDLIGKIVDEHVGNNNSYLPLSELMDLRTLGLCALSLLYGVQKEYEPKATELITEIEEIRWLIKNIINKRNS